MCNVSTLKIYEFKYCISGMGTDTETCIRFAHYNVHVIGALQHITLQFEKSQHSENKT